MQGCKGDRRMARHMPATDISYMVSKFDWLSRDSLIMHHFLSLFIFNGIIIRLIQNDQHIAPRDKIGDEQAFIFVTTNLHCVTPRMAVSRLTLSNPSIPRPKWPARTSSLSPEP